MSERAEFEKVIVRLGYAPAWDGYGYLYEEVQVAWQAWQAARAQSGQGADPVAWTWISGGRHVTADKPYADQLKVDGLDVSPLYTHPHSGEQGGEWVSVKDKQPPILEQCLGWNATANMINKANTYRLFTAAMENTCDISHWMPLPQPPKSKEDRGHE